MKTFEKFPSIPVGFVVEPLIKQLQIALDDTYFYNSVDFDFFAKIAEHPRLQPNHALFIIDTMAKIYLNDLVYAGCAGIVFMQIASRFLQYDEIFDFITKFMTMCFAMLPGLEKPKEKKEETEDKKWKKKPILLGAAAEEQKAKEKEEEIANLYRGMKKTYIIEILRKMLTLKNLDIADMVRQMALVTNYK